MFLVYWWKNRLMFIFLIDLMKLNLSKVVLLDLSKKVTESLYARKLGKRAKKVTERAPLSPQDRKTSGKGNRESASTPARPENEWKR